MDSKAVYYIVQTERELTQEDYAKVISLIGELRGIGISVPENEPLCAYMFYEKEPYRPRLKFIDSPSRLPLPSKRIELECDRTDNFSANILRDVLYKYKYRIYCTDLKCYLPKFMGIMDCVTFTSATHEKCITVMAKYNLKPLFVKENTFVYYAQSNVDNSIHIVNDNLLYYFMHLENPVQNNTEFSYKVAESAEDFVRKFDAELIPFDFYEYFNKPLKIMNFSGFDINNPGRKVFIKPYILEYQEGKTDFYKIAGDDSAMLFMDKIRMGETLDQAILRILRTELKIADDYIGATVAHVIEYDFDKENVLTPRLIVKVYIEKAKMTPEQEAQRNRGWVSIK